MSGSAATDEDFDWGDPDDWECTWCGGEGWEETDNPLWDGFGAMVKCTACNGTGERKHQWLF